MDIQEYRNLVTKVFGNIDTICQKKGADYSSANDTLKNFKETASILNTYGWKINGTPIQASDICTFFEIIKLQRQINLRGRRPENESLDDTITDKLNYCLLGLACLWDEAPNLDEPTFYTITDMGNPSNSPHPNIKGY